MTVGVLNTLTPSRVPALRSWPVTTLMTTNINPVNAAADEPVIT